MTWKSFAQFWVFVWENHQLVMQSVDVFFVVNLNKIE